MENLEEVRTRQEKLKQRVDHAFELKMEVLELELLLKRKKYYSEIASALVKPLTYDF